MGAGSHTESLTLGGRSLTRSASTTGDSDTLLGGTAAPIALAAGFTVTAWVQTDADTAACNLPAGHGYGDGAHLVDVYDSAGVICRYGVTGTITTNAVILEGGSKPADGAGFPATSTVGMIVCHQQQVNVAIDGDLAKLVGVLADVPAHVDFQDGSSDSIRAFSLAEDEPDMWDSGQATNPYTGDPITKAMVSNGSTTAGTLEILVSQDSTP
jgi:hypothetical protein